MSPQAISYYSSSVSPTQSVENMAAVRIFNVEVNSRRNETNVFYNDAASYFDYIASV